ncbi:DEAD/DEAH box helicase [Serratia plymuthica]|uniref:DEAD/DEAH box helicase n=1 Tax=Serratia plymuthica TaxID=82996 RepID=UPI002DBA690B|nr:DEAD/DEAH box helicase [Serratia plymuthica]MEB6540248.1 DEAD/DEAH box helicase [Serratia plymuthica]
MNDFYFKLSNKIQNNQEFTKDKHTLFREYINSISEQECNLDKLVAKKIISTAQIFYYSGNDNLRKEGSILLSMLIEVCAQKHPELIPIANNIFCNVGDFPNISLLQKRFPSISFKFSVYSETARGLRLEMNTVEELDFPLTDFQKDLWTELRSNEDIITVAPTSAGKTHIILSYLINRITNSDGAFAAIIVPTRALISEVSTKIYSILENKNQNDDVEICTIPKDGSFKEKTIFVMTQERLHETLQRGDIYFDYLFIDEAHNISDESRGVLLHITLEKLLEDSSPQIIIGMPSPQYTNSFSSVFRGVTFTKRITAHSPVSKIVMSVIPKGRNLIIERKGTQDSVTIPKNFNKKNLSDIVVRLGKGYSNIIYRNQTNSCDSTADDISRKIINKIRNPILEEAAQYVEHFIHEDYSLASNLRKGVAFHYGPLPTSVRMLVENLVKEGHIDYIVCTSTLAEGVNLPAKNLFLLNPFIRRPYLPSERLEDVKISNITGRAGRMLEHFSGNIFLIEPDDWKYQDYFDDEKDDKEEKIPTYFKLLNENKREIILALTGNISHEDNDKYKYYTVANKLIKNYSNDGLNETFSSSEINLTPTELDEIRKSVRNALENIKVPSFVLEANPTIGYIQQNKIYEFLNSNSNLYDWALPHPKSEILYERLLKICSKLIEFGVFNPSGEYSESYISMISKKWVQGHSLKEMILEQISWDARNNLEEDEDEPSRFNVNKSVRNIIKVINNDIRFRFSNAIKCYHLLLSNIATIKNIDIQSVKLHYYLEVGASDERMIALLNLGLSRETAKELHEGLPESYIINTVNDLMRIINLPVMEKFHAILKKEIVHLLSRS